MDDAPQGLMRLSPAERKRRLPPAERNDVRRVCVIDDDEDERLEGDLYALMTKEEKELARALLAEVEFKQYAAHCNSKVAGKWYSSTKGGGRKSMGRTPIEAAVRLGEVLAARGEEERWREIMKLKPQRGLQPEDEWDSDKNESDNEDAIEKEEEEEEEDDDDDVMTDGEQEEDEDDEEDEEEDEEIDESDDEDSDDDEDEEEDGEEMDEMND